MQALLPARQCHPPPLPPPAARRSARALPGKQQRNVFIAAAADGDSHPPSSQGTDPATPAPAKTPLLDAVLERGGRIEEVPFHVPGHKRGGSTPPGLAAMLGGALRYDLTELDGLDVLSTPRGPIAAAQRAAAAAWGADASWFLVNGTTAGIHAAVLATCGPGQALILVRNAHLSAFNAMVLAGCTPVYAQPCYDSALGVAHAVAPAALQAAFEEAARRGLRVGAALVVSPTYFGVLSDVAGLAAVCHSHGVPLLVDEAHGAHLGLHPSLPPSALQSGADLAVQSTHKQLSAMTQAAMLHVRGERVCRQRLSRALQVLQSSSPSYLLMSSLDAARAQAEQPAAHEESLAAAELARARLAALPGVRLLTAEQAAAAAGDAAASSSTAGSESSSSSSSRTQSNGSSSSSSSSTLSGIRLDPLRLTINLRRLGLSGYEAAAVLEGSFGVVPELSTPTCVVLALSIGSTPRHAEALVAAVEELCRRQQNEDAAGNVNGSSGSSSSSSSGASSSSLAPGLDGSASAPPALPQQPEVRLSPRDAFFAPSEAVPASQAAGRVSAELLCPYPPGVPAAYPGEVLTEAVLAQLRSVLVAGGAVTGCSDASLATVRVVTAAAGAEERLG